MCIYIHIISGFPLIAVQHIAMYSSFFVHVSKHHVIMIFNAPSQSPNDPNDPGQWPKHPSRLINQLGGRLWSRKSLSPNGYDGMAGFWVKYPQYPSFICGTYLPALFGDRPEILPSSPSRSLATSALTTSIWTSRTWAETSPGSNPAICRRWLAERPWFFGWP